MKIYSMPEGFLTDQEVPVRWRLLGILNGFHINGKDLYASNDWLARQLNCSERSISNGVKELEKRGEVHCERTKTSRIIKRTIVNEEEEEGSKRLLGGSQTASIPDSKRLLSISLSNADNILAPASEGDAQDYELEEIRKPRAHAKYPHSKEVFSWFPNPQNSWNSQKNIQEREYAEFLYERGEKTVKDALAFAYKHKDESFFTYHPVWKPSQLEKNWVELTEYKP